MKECTDPETGKLLHGYEINILSEDDTEKFERHLFECEHCLSELQDLSREARLLVRGEGARMAVDDVLREQTESRSLLDRMRSYLWPRAPLVLRPVVPYVLVILLLIPAYHGLVTLPTYLDQVESRSTEGPKAHQSIDLAPVRDLETKVLSKSVSDYGLIEFRFHGARPDQIYRVTVESDDGTVMFEYREFSGFDEREKAKLELPLAHMKHGRYSLTISSMESDSVAPRQVYYFRVIK
jgi:hypothetical protein